MSTLSVTLPDGSSRELAQGATAHDLAKSIGSGLAKAAVAAVVDGVETDLTAGLNDGQEVAIITANTDEGRHVLRHSTAHVLAQAVTRLFPGPNFLLVLRSNMVFTTTSICPMERPSLMTTLAPFRKKWNASSKKISHLFGLRCLLMRPLNSSLINRISVKSSSG